MTDAERETRALTSRLWARLLAPKDIAAIAVFRIALGLLVSVSAARFLAYGWVDVLFSRPAFRFHYWGFDWLPALPAGGMHVAFALMVVLGLLVAAGLFYRLALALLWPVFAYVQLSDVTNYLNHYYLLTLLLGLFLFIPANAAISLDARRRPDIRRKSLPAGYTYLLRFQILTVYFFAGMAKLNSDWLLHAQPLNIWLSARTGLPVVGPFLAERWVAFAAAWFGFLFDTTVAFFLMARRTRAWAYLVVLVFHALTSVLFPIGMFPVIMVLAAAVFFDPSWPRKLVARLRGLARRPELTKSRALTLPELAPVSLRPGRAAWAGLAAAALYAVVQVALPLRAHLYGGSVSWHEQGMRFSWRVMTREKNGTVTFIVRDRATGREWHVPPKQYLNRLQEREMASQPDLILQVAHRIAQDFRAKGHDVEVFADAQASWNGRRLARLIDPTVDLARVQDGLSPKPWILPEPPGAPLHLRPARLARRTEATGTMH